MSMCDTESTCIRLCTAKPHTKDLTCIMTGLHKRVQSGNLIQQWFVCLGVEIFHINTCTEWMETCMEPFMCACVCVCAEWKFLNSLFPSKQFIHQKAYHTLSYSKQTSHCEALTLTYGSENKRWD